MKWVIKKRDNPQQGTYYVAMGKVSNKDARQRKSLYGSNTKIPFDSEPEYLAEIERLKAAGERFVQ